MTKRYVPDYALLGADGYIMGAFTSERDHVEEEALGQHFFNQWPIPIIYDDAERGVILAEVKPEKLKPDALEFVGASWRKAPWWTAIRFRIRRTLDERKTA